MEKKIIAVVGATGAQGGGLVDAILNDPDHEFAVRALTRDPKSDKAKALKARGVEIAHADVNDKESLVKAFKGVYGVFCVTFFWDHYSAEIELEQARLMAEAAEAADVQHLIWSTLEDTRNWVPLEDNRMPTLQEKYKVPHFDAKGEADKYFKDSKVPATLLRTSFYWENFIHFGMGPKRGDDGKLALVMPLEESKMPSMAVRDIGRCALGIFKAGKQYQGKTIGISGEFLSGKEFADTFSKVFEEDVKYVSVPHDVYRGFDFPGADDLGNMYQFKVDFEEVFCGNRDLELSRKLNPKLETFHGWLVRHKDQIPMETQTA